MSDTNIRFEKVDYSRIIARCSEEDFDGHTEFKNMTPLQRLEWLCQAIAFTLEFRNVKKKPSSD